MKQVDISVVVPTYNRAEMFRGALKSLVCQQTNGKFSFEIIVVDNASTDSTKVVFEDLKMSRPVVTIRYVYEEAKGYEHALNRGVKEARGVWLAFFDDDQLAEPNWLKELFAVALKTGAQCVGGAVHVDLPAEQLLRLGRRVCQLGLRDIRSYDDVRRYEGKDVPGGGNVLIARALFDSIGLFDSSMVRGACDIDLFLRARAAGFDMLYTPKAVVRHRISENRLTPRYFRWDALRNGENLAYFDFKYKGLGRMLFFWVARMGQALLINLPLLFFGWIRRDKAEVLTRKSLLWRAEAYTRRALSLIAPKIFRQNRFFASLEFRKGRTLETEKDR